MRSRGERNCMFIRSDRCSKRGFKRRETGGSFLAKEKKEAERQYLSREVMTEGAGSWGKEGAAEDAEKGPVGCEEKERSTF